MLIVCIDERINLPVKLCALGCDDGGYAVDDYVGRDASVAAAEAAGVAEVDDDEDANYCARHRDCSVPHLGLG